MSVQSSRMLCLGEPGVWDSTVAARESAICPSQRRRSRERRGEIERTREGSREEEREGVHLALIVFTSISVHLPPGKVGLVWVWMTSAFKTFFSSYLEKELHP